MINGAHREQIEAETLRCGAVPIHNPDYPQGMLTSVQAGVRAAPAESDWLLIALADQPHLDSGLVHTLLGAALERPQPVIALPRFGERGGHPMLISRAFFEEVLDLPADGGLRELMRRHTDAVLRVPVNNDAVLQDMDTKEAYQALLSRAGHLDRSGDPIRCATSTVSDNRQDPTPEGNPQN